MGELLRDAVSIANMGPAPQWAKVDLEIAAGLPPVEGDKVEIEQVVVNLVRNGIEAMNDLPDDERVLSLGARRGDEHAIEVFVRDRGAGVPPDAAAKIFEPFFTTKGDGMGMGLAICRSIVERHEGRVWFTANDDRGSTFHFTLPVGENSSPGNRPATFTDEGQTAGERPAVFIEER